MTTEARAARLSRPVGMTPAAALVGDVRPAPVVAGGWRIAGRLVTTPFEVTPGSYADADDLLDDPAVDAAVVDGADAALAVLLPELRAAGLLLLLPAPAPLDVDVLRAARDVDGPASAVAFRRRFEPWARTVTAAVPLAGGPPVQVTVRGWPRGERAAAELVDLAALWCGEVVAAVAAPGPLPAEALPHGERVAWALLTASGATVLVSHDGDAPAVRLSFETARLCGGPQAVRWDAGAALPLLGPPPWVRSVPDGVDVGLVAAATALAAATGDRETARVASGDVADLGDLLVVARVLQTLRASARSGAVTPTA
jgi:hypothetical protein